jgi:hypothetical protein
MTKNLFALALASTLMVPSHSCFWERPYDWVRRFAPIRYRPTIAEGAAAPSRSASGDHAVVDPWLPGRE